MFSLIFQKSKIRNFLLIDLRYFLVKLSKRQDAVLLEQTPLKSFLCKRSEFGGNIFIKNQWDLRENFPQLHTPILLKIDSYINVLLRIFWNCSLLCNYEWNNYRHFATEHSWILNPKIWHLKYLYMWKLLILGTTYNCETNFYLEETNTFSVLKSHEARSYEDIFLAKLYLFKVNNRNSRKRCEICSKLTIKTPKRCPAFEVINLKWYGLLKWSRRHQFVHFLQ